MTIKAIKSIQKSHIFQVISTCARSNFFSVHSLTTTSTFWVERFKAVELLLQSVMPVATIRLYKELLHDKNSLL
jgi:hypothetical protein